MGIREVLVPLAPGVTSAAGLLAARLREDRVRTHVKRMDRLKSRELEVLFAQLAAEAEIPLADYTDRYPARRERRLGMRYLGQGYSLMVDLPAGPIRIERAVEDFHASHERQYGFSRKDQTVELVTLWMSVEVDMGTVRYPEAPERRALPEPKHVRPVYFSGRWIDTPVYERETLGAGCVLTGPAVIEQMDATTLLWPGQKAEVNRWGQILLHVEHFGAMAASGVSWRSPVPG
jgi:N-methylhydantoinase A